MFYFIKKCFERLKVFKFGNFDFLNSHLCHTVKNETNYVTWIRYGY